MRDQRMSEEPFAAWMRREWLLVLITVGIGIDWLPFILTAYVPQFGPLSGTRLLVLPGLALACVMRPSWITRPHVMGVAYLLTILIGGGLGWLAGTVSLQRLTTIVVNGLILIYYLQLRSLVSIRRVLAMVFVLSIGVPLIQCLTFVGIISADWLTALGAPTDARVFSIFDTTTPGLVPLLIPACLGGLIFIQSARRRTLVNVSLAAGLVAFGVTSALVAQQRSGVLAYTVSLLIALALYVRWQRKRLILLMVGFVLVGSVALYFAPSVVTPATERFSDTGAYEAARALRYGGMVTFFWDVVENPLNLVPLGHNSLLERTGIPPHLLVAEAYYEGGPLFLVAILAILIKFGRACVALARSPDAATRIVGNCLCAFGGGAAIQIMLQTSLGLRIVPLVLGVAIAAARVRRAEARLALARPA